MVTAAHCLYGGKDLLTLKVAFASKSKFQILSLTWLNLMILKGGAKFRVMLGEHDHCKATSSFVLASAVHKHPKFDPNSPAGDNDIAILKVVQMNDKIG